MVRDKRRDLEYYTKYLSFQYNRIEKFESAIQQVVSERGEDEAVLATYMSIQGFHLNVLNVLYSSGASIEEIKYYYPKVVTIMEKVWNSNSGYVEMVWMLSIGIMLNVREEMDRLIILVEKEGLKDYLIEFLIYSYNRESEIQTSEFKWENPYGLLFKVIHGENMEESKRLLKEYLTKKWYNAHDDAGWHDTHKIMDDYIYSGYWSFESGAIAKILQLDDSILKDVPYYPYDMVHYQEN